MNKKLRQISYITTIILIIILCILGFRLLSKPGVTEQPTGSAVSYISSLSAMDAASVNAALHSSTQKNEPIASSTDSSISIEASSSEVISVSSSEVSSETDAESLAKPVPEDWLLQAASANIKLLSPGELADLRSRFSSTIIIGDSMAQSFSEYGILDEMHVFYKRGATIDLLSDLLPEVAAQYPVNVIFYTGLNDANKYIMIDDYIAEYMRRINEIRSLLPDVNVYVCSMLPPSDVLGATRDDLVRAPMFSGSLYTMCTENNIGYIDTYWMVNQAFYLDDGIHFKADFHHLLLQYMAYIVGL